MMTIGWIRRVLSMPSMLTDAKEFESSPYKIPKMFVDLSNTLTIGGTVRRKVGHPWICGQLNL